MSPHAPRTRIRVRFRRRDEDEEASHTGYVRKMTASRMIITADRPFRPGTRLVLEIPEPPPGFYLEGEVERALRVSQNLRKLQTPLMEIRLLRPEELLSVLDPELAFRPYVISKDLRSSGSQDADSEEVEEDDGMFEAEPWGVDEEGRPLGSGLFPIRYPTREDFEAALEHVAQHTLFVPTTEPSEVGKQVEVTIEVLGMTSSPASIDAQVVQHVPPTEAEPAGGMAVVFVKPAVAMARLRALSANLRN